MRYGIGKYGQYTYGESVVAILTGTVVQVVSGRKGSSSTVAISEVVDQSVSYTTWKPIWKTGVVYVENSTATSAAGTKSGRSPPVDTVNGDTATVSGEKSSTSSVTISETVSQSANGIKGYPVILTLNVEQSVVSFKSTSKNVAITQQCVTPMTSHKSVTNSGFGYSLASSLELSSNKNIHTAMQFAYDTYFNVTSFAGEYFYNEENMAVVKLIAVKNTTTLYTSKKQTNSYTAVKISSKITSVKSNSVLLARSNMVVKIKSIKDTVVKEVVIID